MAMGSARWAKHARTALLAPLGLSLAACLATPPAPPAPPPAAAIETPAETARLPPPHPGKKPAPPAVATLPPAAAAAEPPVRTVEQLQGLDQDGVMAVLGEPQQRAEAPPAQLWRYADRGCELDLYFYRDLQSREMRILHYDIRVTDGSTRTQQGCYGELVAARRADEARSADRPR